jgi:hypothetical protein
MIGSSESLKSLLHTLKRSKHEIGGVSVIKNAQALLAVEGRMSRVPMKTTIHPAKRHVALMAVLTTKTPVALGPVSFYGLLPASCMKPAKQEDPIKMI